jgi:hypothetical protein
MTQQTTNQGNQKNLFKPTQDYIILSNINKGKVLDVSRGSDTGQSLIWTLHGGPNQRYKIKPSINGRYVL